MGNNTNYTNSNRNNFNDLFKSINEEDIVDLRYNYKIIYVDYLDTDLIHSKMYDNNTFLLPRKKNIINNMLEYYLNHNDPTIYQKIDYLCNEKEKLCICNSHADDFRKIYDGIYYKPNKKFISWFKE